MPLPGARPNGAFPRVGGARLTGPPAAPAAGGTKRRGNGAVQWLIGRAFRHEFSWGVLPRPRPRRCPWENHAMSEFAVPLPMDAIHDFCRKWKIAKLEVFGSILRADFGPASDVDFLVTFEPSARWGLEIVEMEHELAGIVGRRVDLVSRRAVEDSDNWIRRQAILESAQAIHIAA